MSAIENSLAFKTDQLTVSLGQTKLAPPILREVSLEILQARWTCIVGPNGAGKSTLLKTLAGLLPFSGDVQLLGCPLREWSNRDRGRTLSWLDQNGRSADGLRVFDVVMLGRIPHQPWLAPAGEQDRLAVEQALRSTQAWQWRERALGQLSGGERQRVLLARALAVQAQVFLMDEPLANLDPPHQVDWLELVHELIGQGKTVISVLHEISVALQADDLVVMDQGRVLHHGPSNEAKTHQALESVFNHRIKLFSCEGQWVVLPQIKS